MTEQSKSNETKQEKTSPQAKKSEQDKESAKSWSSNIKKLGDQIVKLTLMQAKELGDYLKTEYDIEPAGAVAVAAPGGFAEGGAGEQPEEKTTFDVILKEFGDKKIQVIKEVRALTGLGLKEAKDLVDNVPRPVKESLNKEEAESVQKQLEAAGAVVELK
ncbi:MAG: 50S ribosomal protein L7/L12 [Sedimentisphaerales bacterium]|nr:50S ribosomal protein L7/L12 [Sedimentisphaerales bacterium]